MIIDTEDLTAPIKLGTLSIGDTFILGGQIFFVSDRSSATVSVRTLDGTPVSSDPSWAVHKVKIEKIAVSGV